MWAIFYAMITFYRDYGKIGERKKKMQLRSTVIRLRKTKKEKENVITSEALVYLQWFFELLKNSFIFQVSFKSSSIKMVIFVK